VKVILKQDVKNLGKKGEMVEVAEGYARNFLIPRGVAVAATSGAVKSLETEKRNQEAREQRIVADLKALRDRLAGATVKVPVRSGEGGRLYGSVTNKDIADAVSKFLGREFDRRVIELEHPIKTLGTYEVRLKFGHQISGKVSVEIVPE
jgi:large subunit ribosomal protein L9